jgi:hypothetical protein
MIAAYLPDAYPVNFREFGPVDRERLNTLVRKDSADKDLMHEIRLRNVRYVLLENKLPLARVLAKAPPGFLLRYENASYKIWQVDVEADSVSLRDPGT